MPRFWKYPSEVEKFIQDNVSGTSTKRLTTLLNLSFSEKYSVIFTESMIRSYKKNHNLKSGTPGGWGKGTSLKFPNGMLEYIQSTAPGKTTKEIAQMAADHFGICFTPTQCRAYKKNHKINSGLDLRFQKGHEPANKGKHQKVTGRMAETMFKKGNIPHNTMTVGDLTHTTDGYLVQKIAEPNKWEFVHRATWEEHNGPIPDGKMVSFLNGNKDDCAIENLFLIDNDINLEMNRRKLRTRSRELTQTGANVARLSVATAAAKKRVKKHKRNGGPL